MIYLFIDSLTLTCTLFLFTVPDFELDIYSNLTTTPQTPYSEGAPVQPPPQLTSKYSRAVQIFRNIMASRQEEEIQQKEPQCRDLRVIFQDNTLDIIVEDWDSERRCPLVL